MNSLEKQLPDFDIVMKRMNVNIDGRYALTIIGFDEKEMFKKANELKQKYKDIFRLGVFDTFKNYSISPEYRNKSFGDEIKEKMKSLIMLLLIIIYQIVILIIVILIVLLINNNFKNI